MTYTIKAKEMLMDEELFVFPFRVERAHHLATRSPLRLQRLFFLFRLNLF